MKFGIVLKLFLLTTTLCVVITSVIYLGQTIFFKQYYANRKVDDLKTNIESFKKQYQKSNESIQKIQQLEQDFYRNKNTWITTLDRNGNLKTANEYTLTVKIEKTDKPLTAKTITIPLYHLINFDDDLKKEQLIYNGDSVNLYLIKKNDIVTTLHLDISQKNTNFTNKMIWEKISNSIPTFGNKNVQDYIQKYRYIISGDTNMQVFRVQGHVVSVQYPDRNDVSSIIFSNNLFLDRINEFQTNLMFNNNNRISDFRILDFKQNDIKYKIFIDPVIDKNGNDVNYIFAMASLQPVDEAAQMVKDYFIYIIGFVLLLSVLASFYYSIKIARPLLKINKTTSKIAQLDFSERIDYISNDEIGDLSHNINLLSNTLYSHITELRSDIENEKKLENTRKEFIAGVSHELKTPLSIMKSCISILKDGVAIHKKDYYFEAMTKEVDKMDLLIIEMLQLAKYESGTYKMKLAPFYIDTIIEHICNQLKLEFERKQLIIQKDIAPIEVLANQHRIEQVLTNFVTNAIRYTPVKEHIYISTIDENQQVKVCVENKGVNIPYDQLDKVWERFYRGDTSRQRLEGSTGLGLAISKNILELHDVQYGVTNTSNGVLFYFYLNKNL